MPITKKSLEMVVENVKNFFNDLLSPNMTIEDVADVASMRLDEIIRKNVENGLTYSAGKFRVNFVDDEHFNLEFEMYFQDADKKWHKLANASEPRDIKLLEIGAQKTVKALQTIEFPVNAPDIKPPEKAAEPTETEPAEKKSDAEPVTIDITPSEPAAEKSDAVNLKK
ncbi:MAG: hypothetical protein J5809_04710 [Selenomonadaceae bacterium]|nr:hypothetical protein [Selenomonadaceae bacterium]